MRKRGRQLKSQNVGELVRGVYNISGFLGSINEEMKMAAARALAEPSAG